jgi:hypothetical protein
LTRRECQERTVTGRRETGQVNRPLGWQRTGKGRENGKRQKREGDKVRKVTDRNGEKRMVTG